MANDPVAGWQPEWSVAPGEILLETLQDREMTQSELAHRTARPLKTISEIINGKAAITPETALQLERVLGISALVWTNLETAYRTRLARDAAQRELERSAQWVDEFPVGELVRHGLIRKGSTKTDTLEELLTFFQVSSPAAFERHWLAHVASFRASPSFEATPKALAAWLRWGEIEAEKVAVEAFQRSRFLEVLKDVRPLTRRGPFVQILNRVQIMCASVGVVVVLTPELRETHLSGAARWIGARALIQLSLRHKSDDQFWFSFYHEAGHVLTSGRQREFLDGREQEEDAAKDRDEAEVDAFARDTLLPPQPLSEFIARGGFSATDVRAFAEDQQVAPGIVVGRLQRDGLVPRTHLNDLKRKLNWPN